MEVFQHGPYYRIVIVFALDLGPIDVQRRNLGLNPDLNTIPNTSKQKPRRSGASAKRSFWSFSPRLVANRVAGGLSMKVPGSQHNPNHTIYDDTAFRTCS